MQCVLAKEITVAESPNQANPDPCNYQTNALAACHCLRIGKRVKNSYPRGSYKLFNIDDCVEIVDGTITISFTFV